MLNIEVLSFTEFGFTEMIQFYLSCYNRITFQTCTRTLITSDFLIWHLLLCGAALHLVSTLWKISPVELGTELRSDDGTKDTICTYIHAHKYIHILLHIYTYIYIRRPTHKYTHIYIYIRRPTHKYILIYMYIYLFTYIHTQLYICVCMSIQFCTYTCMEIHMDTRRHT